MPANVSRNSAPPPPTTTRSRRSGGVEVANPERPTRGGNQRTAPPPPAAAINGHRAARKKAIVEESEDDEEDEDEEDEEEPMDEDDDDEEEEEEDADGDEDMDDAPILPPQPAASSRTQPAISKPSLPAQPPVPQPIPDDDDDDEELSDLESPEEDMSELDAEGEEEEIEEDAEGEEDVGEEMVADNDLEDDEMDDDSLLGSSDEGTPAKMVRGETPDLSKMTQRQRVAFTGKTGEMMALSNGKTLHLRYPSQWRVRLTTGFSTPQKHKRRNSSPKKNTPCAAQKWPAAARTFLRNAMRKRRWTLSTDFSRSRHQSDRPKRIRTSELQKVRANLTRTATSLFRDRRPFIRGTYSERRGVRSVCRLNGLRMGIRLGGCLLVVGVGD